MSATEAPHPGSTASWEAPPQELTLASGEVHVWRAALDRPERVREQLARKLSGEERARADRVQVARERERWMMARALLRAILGRYLETSPEHVALDFDPSGKPLLAAGSGASLSFNLSHSGELALYAVTGGAGVGVDVERVREDLDFGRIAGRLFSATEQAALRELPEPDRLEAFFGSWTRREARAKAVGKGLAGLFASASPPGGEHAEILSGPGEAFAADPWTVWDLVPKPGYAAAVAVEGKAPALRCLDLTKTEKLLLRGRFPRPAGD